MTISQTQKVNSNSLQTLLPFIGTIVYGKLDIPINADLSEKVVDNRYLVTGVIGKKNELTVRNYSLFLEGIDHDYQMETSSKEFFKHFKTD